jgi:uncharacterized 2Fe-2S/4Fe-4S cluster protein (DUF4445 family)
MNVRFSPHDSVHEAHAGETLLDVAERAGVPIERVCGGRGTCGKCVVVIEQGSLSPLTAAERQRFSEDDLRAGYRLACQARLLSGVDIVAHIPDAYRRAPIQILSSGAQHVMGDDPWVKRRYLTVPPADLEDPIADLEAVRQCDQQGSTAPETFGLSALRQLPAALRAQDGRITLISVDGDVLRVEAGHTDNPLLGVAYDIGTTTVVGYLMDLLSGETLAVASELNPQTRFGDNVISRIQYADESNQGLQTLQSEVAGALNRILASTCETVSRPPHDVLAMTVVGNTTMQHLLLGVSPTYLARSPYIPAYASAQRVRAAQLGLNCDPEAAVWLLPNIAGWVGADTVAMLLSTGLYAEPEMSLAIDIGTNGEMAMGSRGRIITCSAAAGPAFEGAHISSGMRAAEGAIDRVTLDGDVQWHTIADGTPRGICGSGLVDAISEMLRVGVLDGQGRLQSPETMTALGFPALAARIRGENRHRTFELVSAGSGTGGRPVQLTQRDVREVQLAKGAIRAGIEILMKELGAGPADVRKVYLAGAFGNYIQPDSALGIGLLPAFPRAELIPVGNAAGSGARMALLSRGAREMATQMLAHVTYLELSTRTDFQEEFVEAMLF